MNGSSKVSVYDVTEKVGRARPWLVRRRVNGTERSSSFATKKQADAYRSRLQSAALAGKLFDLETGEPVEWNAADGTPTFLELVDGWWAVKRPRMAAKTRKSAAEALASFLPSLVAGERRPATPDHALYTALVTRFRDGQAALSASDADRVRRLADTSVRIGRLSHEDVTAALEALSRKLTGQPAAATTVRRKRAVLYNVLRRAVSEQHIPANPLDSIDWRPEDPAPRIDRRCVGSPREVRALLTHVRVGRGVGTRYGLLFATLFFAGLRPGEAAGLRVRQVELPATDDAWGTLYLEKSTPQAGKAWTDSGTSRDVRGLKHRGASTVRPVPIPPELVALLRPFVAGRGGDELVFATTSGQPVPEGEVGEQFRSARAAWAAEVEGETGKPVAEQKLARPYDMRHSAASLWLNAGVPPTDVADRLGHGVEVLMRVYADCIEDHRERHNARIEAALLAG